MNQAAAAPLVSICVLTYGDFPELARRCLGSIRRHCHRPSYQLIVGANAVGKRTREYLAVLKRAGQIDDLLVSARNLNKCPMMRRMFRRVKTEFIWWFDDDSWIRARGAMERLLELARASPPETVMWGQVCVCASPSTFTDLEDVQQFVRRGRWYRGLTPPGWEPGGKGEFDFEARGTGDGRWLFVTGGSWLIRTRAVRLLDWPDRRLIKLGDDVLLGEAIRQQGWVLHNTGGADLVINGAKRRGDPGGLQQPKQGAPGRIQRKPQNRSSRRMAGECRRTVTGAKPMDKRRSLSPDRRRKS